MDERQQFLEQLEELGADKVRENLELGVYTISWKHYLAEEFVRRAPASSAAPDLYLDNQYEKERILLEELQRANARAGTAMAVAVLALLLGLGALVVALVR